MLKLVGLCCVVFCGVGAGWLGVLHLRQECGAVQRLCQLLRELSVQMTFRAVTVQELFVQICEESAYAMFLFPKRILMEMEQEKPLTMAWQIGLEADNAIPEAAKKILLPLGDELGASELSGQVETLAQYRRQMEEYLQELIQRSANRQRLYLSMGALGGLMAAILLC